jgi:hypothetical protein
VRRIVSPVPSRYTPFIQIFRPSTATVLRAEHANLLTLSLGHTHVRLRFCMLIANPSCKCSKRTALAILASAMKLSHLGRNAGVYLCYARDHVTLAAGS